MDVNRRTGVGVVVKLVGACYQSGARYTTVESMWGGIWLFIAHFSTVFRPNFVCFKGVNLLCLVQDLEQ